MYLLSNLQKHASQACILADWLGVRGGKFGVFQNLPHNFLRCGPRLFRLCALQLPQHVARQVIIGADAHLRHSTGQKFRLYLSHTPLLLSDLTDRVKQLPIS